MYDPNYFPQAFNAQGFNPQASGVPPFVGNRRTHCNTRYICSIGGLLRVVIILALIGGIIAAALVPIIYSGVFQITSIYASARDGYLAVTCISLIFSVFLYIVFLRGCAGLECANRVPWNLLVFFSDIMWVLAIIPVSVMATIRETNARNDGSISGGYIRNGAFAAAAALGYFAVLVYALDALYHLCSMCRRGVLLPKYAQYYPEYAYAN